MKENGHLACSLLFYKAPTRKNPKDWEISYLIATKRL
jgi:hypothetical protein